MARWVVLCSLLVLVTSCSTAGSLNTGLGILPEHRRLPRVWKALYVANSECPTAHTGPCPVAGSVTKYHGNIFGNVIPVARIEGSQTTLDHPVGVAIGPLGTIYVLNFNNDNGGDIHIAEFDPGSDGNVAPLATIDIPNPPPSPRGAEGIAVDRSGFIYVSLYDVPQAGGSSVLVYSPKAVGNAMPLRIINGKRTRLFDPIALGLDADENIYVANQNPGLIRVYAAGADGNVPPIATFNPGPLCTGASPMTPFVGSDGTLYVANLTSIELFAPPPSRHPLASISGDKTQIGFLWGIVADENKNVYVTDERDNSILFFRGSARGNVSPAGIIAGPATMLSGPLGIALSSEW